MCQAYEAEYQSICSAERYAARNGFKAALLGEPQSSNPYSAWLKYEPEAWDHGWRCWHERILPWAFERTLREDGDYAGAQAIEQGFRDTGQLSAEVRHRLGLPLGDNMSVRAKLSLTSITEHTWGGKTLKFTAQYDATIPEDQRFQKATPSGSIELQIDNPAALVQFTLGKSYYVDFSEAL